MTTQALTKENLMDLYNRDLDELLAISKKYMKNGIEFCSLVNARNGKCSQNCKYCAQSSHYNTDIESYPLISPEEVKGAIRKMSPYVYEVFEESMRKSLDSLDSAHS